MPPVERCRPLLGTFVRIRVEGLSPECANIAIGAAFNAMASIHQLMSFHEAESDVSRLNRKAFSVPVAVDERTYEVLKRAIEFSKLSSGIFDATIAPELVARGHLPAPDDAPEPDTSASWRDIVLLENNRVRFQKPLWIDLGGIAKGYAVDCAIATLQTFAPMQASVNAGGDLRVIGDKCESVRLAPDRYKGDIVAIANIQDGSVASSCGHMAMKSTRSDKLGPHVDPRADAPDAGFQFVSVLTQHCVDADAMTKIVMALKAESASVLSVCVASAITYDAQSGWQRIGGMA